LLANIKLAAFNDVVKDIRIHKFTVYYQVVKFCYSIRTMRWHAACNKIITKSQIVITISLSSNFLRSKEKKNEHID